MSLQEVRKRNHAIARGLGALAKDQGLRPDALLDDPGMRQLCTGLDCAGVKSLVGAFVEGWKTWTPAELKTHHGLRPDAVLDVTYDHDGPGGCQRKFVKTADLVYVYHQTPYGAWVIKENRPGESR